MTENAGDVFDLPTIWRELSSHHHRIPSQVHGPEHWRRVESNGLILAEHTPQADLIVVRLFAVFHDSQRQNDGSDPEHGSRAAELVRRKQGEWFKLTDQQLSLLVNACRDHTGGSTSTDPTIGCCWDADRLDLPRVGIQPHPRFMSTQTGKELAYEISNR